jgi:hypothetical protein
VPRAFGTTTVRFELGNTTSRKDLEHARNSGGLRRDLYRQLRPRHGERPCAVRWRRHQRRLHVHVAPALRRRRWSARCMSFRAAPYLRVDVRPVAKRRRSARLRFLARSSVWLGPLAVDRGLCIELSLSEVRRTVSPWCGRRDSNPHNFRHWNLNPARLPIPPRPPPCGTYQRRLDISSGKWSASLHGEPHFPP